MQTISMNDMVQISLTHRGHEVVTSYYSLLNRAICNQTRGTNPYVVGPDIDPNTGCIKMPLWEVLELFGPKVHIGGDTLFVLVVP